MKDNNKLSLDEMQDLLKYLASESETKLAELCDEYEKEVSRFQSRDLSSEMMIKFDNIQDEYLSCIGSNDPIGIKCSRLMCIISQLMLI